MDYADNKLVSRDESFTESPKSRIEAALSGTNGCKLIRLGTVG